MRGRSFLFRRCFGSLRRICAVLLPDFHEFCLERFDLPAEGMLSVGGIVLLVLLELLQLMAKNPHIFDILLHTLLIILMIDILDNLLHIMLYILPRLVKLVQVHLEVL